MIIQYYNSGYVTSGSYFTFQRVRYGSNTIVKFKDAFYDRMMETQSMQKNRLVRLGRKDPYYRTFHSISPDGCRWHFGDRYDTIFNSYIYDNIVPDKDIEKIIVPVYYMEPKELVCLRLNNGSWIGYIWKETLFYAFWLLVSPIFNQWYLIWTIGLYVYLRTSYITLSKGELCNGWQN